VEKERGWRWRGAGGGKGWRRRGAGEGEEQALEKSRCWRKVGARRKVGAGEKQALEKSRCQRADFTSIAF
jgi:hypothetical protein